LNQLRPSPVFTGNGVRLLGRLIREARESQDPKLTIHQLRDWLIQTSVQASYGTLQGLERPREGYEPSWQLINAIARLGFVKNPVTDRPWTTTELMLIACEWIDPRSGKLINQGFSMTADNEFVRLVRQQFPTEAELVAASGMTEEEAAGIFRGEYPEIPALGFLADVLLKDPLDPAGPKWTTDELADLCYSIYDPRALAGEQIIQPTENNNPSTAEQQRDRHVGNGASK
jgi:hypothetical protein